MNKIPSNILHYWLYILRKSPWKFEDDIPSLEADGHLSKGYVVIYFKKKISIMWAAK